MPLPRPFAAAVAPPLARSALLAATLLAACSDSTEPLAPPIARIAVAGLVDTAGVGDTLRLTARALDSADAPIARVATRWRSLTPAVATVDSAGRVVVLDVGEARLVVSARGRTTVEDTLIVQALLLPSRVHIAGLSATLGLGTILHPNVDTASAEVHDGRGSAIAEPVYWSVSDAWVLAVDSVKGVVAARGAGTAWVRARAGRARDSVRVEVPVVPLMPGHAWVQLAGHTLNAPYETCALDTAGQVWCEGASGTPLRVPGATRLRELHGGESQYCGLDAQGVVHCFGRDGSRVFGAIVRPAPLSRSDSLYLGGGGRRFLRYDLGEHAAACGIQAADSVVYCWGHNDHGQVGRLPIAGTDSAVAPVSGSLKATLLDLTGFSGCAMALDQSVWCWGSPGHYGGTNASGIEPRQLQPSGRYVSIAAGEGTVCGLSADGAASCWRSAVGKYPAQGVPAASPRPLTGSLRFTRIVSRDYSTEFCGLTAAGALHCWDAYEWVGPEAMRPFAVLPGRMVTSVTLGRYRRCAVVTGGDAFCF